MALLILTFLTLFCAATYGANCTANSCKSCITLAECGWCAPTQECIEGTMDGPTNSSCVGASWSFDRCVPCESFLDCHTCTDHDSDCVFCPALNNFTGGCRPIGFTCAGIPRNGCPCNTFDVCSGCVSDGANGNCTWCQGSSSCVANATTCPSGPSFNLTTGCSCAANQDCRSCNENGCDWCLSGECSDRGTCTGPSTQVCNAYCSQSAQTCTDCVAENGCAWCPSSSTCVDQVTHPCQYSVTCPACNRSSTCDSCHIMDGCVWCDDAGVCEPSTNTTCASSMTCSAYCQKATDCSSCNAKSGCLWCYDTNVCENLDGVSPQCAYSPSCTSPVESRHFDGSSFVGGMFLVIGLIVAAIGVYFFYRWKTGKKLEYRAI